jgi:hypothetical protein
MILCKPSALILRFAFGVSGVSGTGSDSPLIFAQRAFCASFMRRRVAALNFLRVPVWASGVAASPVRGAAVGSASISRSAVSARSMAVFGAQVGR